MIGILWLRKTRATQLALADPMEMPAKAVAR